MFEVTGKQGSRRLVLREADQDVNGLLGDAQEKILWITKKSEAGYRYAGYDVRSEELRDPGASYVGARTTKPNFVPQDAYDGSVAGWIRQTSGELLAASYDMRVDLLRRRSDPRD